MGPERFQNAALFVGRARRALSGMGGSQEALKALEDAEAILAEVRFYAVGVVLSDPAALAAHQARLLTFVTPSGDHNGT